jgi:tetratricopeptide (TPR) repeat protein
VLVHQPASPSANAFEFGHRLLEEAAYESADVRDRGRWHERAARWLEGVLHAAPNHNTARWTAQHWERAGRLARAVSAYRRAATLARSSYAMAEADSLLARAQVLAHAMGGGPALLDVLYDRVRVAEFRSDAAAVDELLGLLEAALPDARLSAEQLAVWGATLAYTRAVAAVRRKDVPAALELTLRGLVLLEAAPRAKSARLLRARLGNWQGWCLLRLNRPADAQRAYAEALQSLGKRGSERERSTLQSALALALQRAGAPDETVRRSHERAIRTKERLAATTGDKKPLGAARINYACYLLEKGRMEWALRELAQAQSIAAAIGDPEMEAVVEVNLAECHLGCRRAADALRHLDRATRVATAHALHWVLAETQALVSRAREAVK